MGKRAVITLTTDFGLSDAYVAAMKGVILSINPGAVLVDISHDIGPQKIAQAAFVLSTACDYFPAGTVHLVVVDPGVGTGRRAVIVKTPRAFFVTPDNGVLSLVVSGSADEEAAGKSGLIRLGEGIEAFAITKPRFWRTPVSPTFHGRDIFAPVAARLSLGQPPADFGEKIGEIVGFPFTRVRQGPDGSIIGQVIYVDHFGNLVTNIRQGDLPDDIASCVVEIGGRSIQRLVKTYAEGEGLLALIGSSGHLEIAFRDGSAAAWLPSGVGDKVMVRPGRKG